MNRRIVTIDGPAGAGKTTVSKSLAKALGCIYVDTGALYRGVAYEISRQNIDWKDEEKLAASLKTLDLKFSMQGSTLSLFSYGNEITTLIRTNEISMLASATSASPLVRQALLGIQKSIAIQQDAVFEGRDMGTTVFPDAAFKFFLTADVQVRAKRRFEEIKTGDADFKKILEDMKKRDTDDSQRAVSPLKPAHDAVLIDATRLNAHQVVEKMRAMIEMA